MQIAVQKGIPLPAMSKNGKAKPEYLELAKQIEAMQIGDSFSVHVDDATKVRYVAQKLEGVYLVTRKVDADTVGFWRVAEKAPRAVKAKVAPAVAEAADQGGDAADGEQAE